MDIVNWSASMNRIDSMSDDQLVEALDIDSMTDQMSAEQFAQSLTEEEKDAINRRYPDLLEVARRRIARVAVGTAFIPVGAK